MIKDNYGFIELNRLANHNNNSLHSQSSLVPRDIFFHFSKVHHSAQSDLDVGDEVEFKINRKNKTKLCAESVTKLPSGTLIKPATKNQSNIVILKGKIVQPLRSHSNNVNSNFNSSMNNSQEQVDDAYYGKILLINTDNNNKKENENNNKKIIYQFGMFSLNDKRNFHQNGDLVTFQLIESGNKKFAFNVNYTQISNQQEVSQRSRNGASISNSNNNSEYKRGKIDSIKGHCGYIEYGNISEREMKKIFFHISDVQADLDQPAPLKPGDDVEFTVSHNPRNNKYSANRIKRLATSKDSTLIKQENAINNNNNDTDNNNKRPERLITKLKLANVDKSGKQLVLTRQPNNPADMGKTKSFSRILKERLPGSLTPLTNMLVESARSASSSDEAKVDTDNNNEATNMCGGGGSGDVVVTSQINNNMSIMDLLMGVQS